MGAFRFVLGDTGGEAPSAIGTAPAAVVAQTAFSVGAALLYWLLLRSGRVPRWLAAWGLVTAPLFLVAGFLLPFTGDPNSAVSSVLYAPMGLQELVFAVWMIGWGFRPTTPTTPTIEERTAWTPATTS